MLLASETLSSKWRGTKEEGTLSLEEDNGTGGVGVAAASESHSLYMISYKHNGDKHEKDELCSTLHVTHRYCCTWSSLVGLSFVSYGSSHQAMVHGILAHGEYCKRGGSSEWEGENKIVKDGTL